MTTHPNQDPAAVASATEAAPMGCGNGREDLMETAATLRGLLERLDEGVLIIQEGVVATFNTGFAGMTGWAADEITGRPFTGFIQGAGEGEAPRLLCRQEHPTPWSGGPIRYPAKLKGKGGEFIPVDVSAGPAAHHGKPADLVIIKDASNQKKLKEEIEKSRQLESIAALSGGIAHDYNNLLTAILGNISLALADIAPGEDIYSLLEETQKAALLAKELTQKLITFSRGEKPVTETAPIAPLVKSAAEFSLSGSNVKATFHFPPNLWPAKINQNQIGQAIYNLVINAREAMPDGGVVRITARNIAIGEGASSLDPGEYVMITIKDQGVGIPPENLGKIFDPYFTTKERGADKGTGLGLSICHSIIKKHGGDIAVESKVGRGANMYVFLPSSKEPVTPPSVVETPRPGGAVAGRGKVLVMDDEERILVLAERMLQRLGYEAEFSRDGDEAISMYRAALEAGAPFDVVVLDLTVRGGMGGKKAIQEILRLDPDVKAIVSSGYSNDPVMADYRKYGFKGVVAKPYSLQELSARLNDVIAAP
ncbi:MAG: response regulator [Desulfobacterales bacterium]|nr:response regulator [Desulfobacterales bacterium]